MKNSCERVKFILKTSQEPTIFEEQKHIHSVYKRKKPVKCRTFLAVLTDRNRLLTIDEWDYVLSENEIEKIKKYYQNSYQQNLINQNINRTSWSIEL